MGSGITVWEGCNIREAAGRGALRRAGVVPVVVFLASMALAAPLSAQLYGPRMGSRADLTATLDSLERARAAAVGERAEELARAIHGIQSRLEQGDIDAGDVVWLRVTGQERWTDSFTVTPARTLELPDIQPVSLDGVLYSEAEETVSRALARYLQEPQVRLDVLKRVAVLGAVGKPGFYHIRGSALVSEVVMDAGGPAGDAKLQKVRVRRGGDPVELPDQRIAFQNLSLDQLGVVSGDELFVPRGGTSIWRVTLGVLGGLSSLVFLITRF